MKQIKTIVLTGSAALFLSACGGGGSSSDMAIIPTAPAPAPTSVSGGTASAPATIILNLKHEISSDSSSNYFKYSGKENEKLTIHVSLDRALTAVDKNNCQYASDTFIEISDEDLNLFDSYRTCSTDMTVVLPVDGEYIFYFNYPM